jgi:hypothetical protein
VHGVIFTSFRDFVTTRFGTDVARSVQADRPLHLMTEAYPDEEFFELLRKTCEETSVEMDELVRDFGVFAGGKTFPRLYPAFFEVAGGSRAFMLTVEGRIHELVRATIPNARPPQLGVAPLGEESVQVSYSSPRQLCVLLRGLAEGTAEHFGEQAHIEEAACMRRGDPACLFEIRFTRLSPVA